MKAFKKFMSIFMLFLVVPLAAASHDHFDSVTGKKHPNEGKYDLKAIALTGPFGVDPVGQKFNIEAFREGEGSVIRSRPYYWGSRVVGDHYYGYGNYHYGVRRYNDDHYRHRIWRGYSDQFSLVDGRYPKYTYNRGFKRTSYTDRGWPYRKHYSY